MNSKLLIFELEKINEQYVLLIVYFFLIVVYNRRKLEVFVTEVDVFLEVRR